MAWSDSISITFSLPILYFCRIVPKNEQNLDLQVDSLKKAGCDEKNIFTDKITGTKAQRVGLEQALSHLRAGDTLVVWRLDRLGRSLKHLIETITKLQKQNIAFKSITENIDTSRSYNDISARKATL